MGLGDYAKTFIAVVAGFLFAVSFHKLIYIAVYGWLENRGITDPTTANLLILIGSGAILILLGKSLLKKV